MKVTKIEAVAKTKFKIELDEEFAFVLYKGELSQYGIRIDEEISEEVYQRIRKEVILKRAKLRAMHLLTDMARTESGLRQKLGLSMYPNDIIEEALQYVKSFGYLDDSRYAENYILSKKSSKSKREIYAALCEKGVSRELIDQAFENCYQDGEREAVRQLIRKRNIDITNASDQELHKLYGYLARKGFRYDDIRYVIENW